MVTVIALHCTSYRLKDNVMYRYGKCSVIQNKGLIRIVIDGNPWDGINVQTFHMEDQLDVFVKPNIDFDTYMECHYDKPKELISKQAFSKLFEDLVDTSYTSDHSRYVNWPSVFQIQLFGMKISDYVKV